MEEKTSSVADQIKRLQACINDLVSVQALASVWSGQEPHQIVDSLLEVLVLVLRLDFAYARVGESIEASCIERLRLPGRPGTEPREIIQAISSWLMEGRVASCRSMPSPVGDGELYLAQFGLGLRDEIGIIVCGSRRADFPVEAETLLLRVAANQAVIALHEAQFRSDQRRVTHQLERRVAERTAQLTTVDEDLRKEIIERKDAEEALKTSEERFQLLVWGVKDYAIYMLDVDGRVMTWNNGAGRIKGYHAEEILGKHFSAFYQPEDIQADRPAQGLRIAVAEGRFEEEGWRLRKDGSRFWANAVITALKDRSGKLQGFAKVTRDITESKQAEEKLRRSEGYLAEGQRLSCTGSWAWNVSTGEIYWSQEHFRIFGLQPEKAKISWEIFFEMVHPEDRSALQQGFEQAVREKSDFEDKFRIVWPDGSIKYIHSLSHPVFNESGAITEYVGTVIDRTEQHEASATLEQAFEEIKLLKDRLHHENIALREEVDRTGMFEEIVGSSSALKSVLSRVAKVASTDSTVLISGETGTGKELIARAIHKRSKRASRPFVAFNCASVPPTLIASELFGHEKGAFTGAQLRRLGRFELAEGGTIFLDEVGDLPAETQIILLRVIQEREFERVGGSHPISTNARVIAATNRNLEDEIVAGTFRLDLFYRLNVFPIELPSLRERKADIPALIEYFVKRHAMDAGKRIRMVDKKTAELFQSYAWPGNIRELQSIIERSVILCEGEILSVDPSWLSVGSAKLSRRACSLAERLQEEEKKFIESALAESNGKISGYSGAAAKLGIPSSTLESKIKTLKIKKYNFKSA